MHWYNTSNLPSKNYICGHCNNDIISNKGYYLANSHNSGMSGNGYVYVCHKCNKPTYISGSLQVPGATYGKKYDEQIFNGDKLLFQLYEEARNTMKVMSFTSVGLCCRKLLMHIAVNCGAEENLKFIDYINYLDKNNYIPKNAKMWVDIIRDKGNEANHEIMLLDQEDAKKLLTFIEILISLIYDMPYIAKNI